MSAVRKAGRDTPPAAVTPPLGPSLLWPVVAFLFVLAAAWRLWWVVGGSAALDDLIARLPTLTSWRLPLFGSLGLAATLGTIALGIVQTRILMQGGVKILDFELAGSSAVAARLMTGWGTAGRRAAFRSLQIDQWFVVGYVLALSLFSVQSALWLRQLEPGIPTVALFVLTLTGIFVAVLAGCLDVTENLCLFSELENRQPYDGTDQQKAFAEEMHAADLGMLPAIAARCANIKFALSLLLLITIAGVAVWRGLVVPEGGGREWTALPTAGLAVLMFLALGVPLAMRRAPR